MKNILTILFSPWMLVVYAAAADCYAAYIIKLKFNELGELKFTSFEVVLRYITTLLKSGLFLSGLLAYIMAPFLSFVALNRLELSVYYPVPIIFHLVFVVVLAMTLGESLSVYRSIGLLLIIISLFFLYKS